MVGSSLWRMPQSMVDIYFMADMDTGFASMTKLG